MITDPTMEELMNISRDYKIDMDDLKAALDTEERSDWRMKMIIQ